MQSDEKYPSENSVPTVSQVDCFGLPTRSRPHAFGMPSYSPERPTNEQAKTLNLVQVDNG